MRPDHRDVFFRAAQHRSESGEQVFCWIGVREPNPLAEKWIGWAGYTSKPMNCKAKTADNPAFMLSGLVVDPNVRPEAFRAESLKGAIESWRRFLADGGGSLPRGYWLVESGPEAGLLRLWGCGIFSDYDLMVIVRSNADGEFLTTTYEQEKQLLDRVSPVLGRGMRLPMIRHGTEFMYDRIGAKSFEWILWFGPGRRCMRWTSSMPVDRPH